MARLWARQLKTTTAYCCPHLFKQIILTTMLTILSRVGTLSAFHRACQVPIRAKIIHAPIVRTSWKEMDDMITKSGHFRAARCRPGIITKRCVHTVRDADLVEQMMGGQRYCLLPLPDCMIPTTIFVGNLNEFVKDDDLSKLFATVSSLRSVPACVVRKPDTSSLRYGFVTFRTVHEKELAILKFHNFDWRGTKLRVEPIREDLGNHRVRIPESMVTYVTGHGRHHGSSSNSNGNIYNSNNKPNGNNYGPANLNVRRISRDDVTRLGRGQPSKVRGYGSRRVPHRLNEVEQAEFDRACRKGFVSVTAMGYRRTRKDSPLLNLHRQWCDARARPQIVLRKAASKCPNTGCVWDQVLVDLSPLRLNGLTDDDDPDGVRVNDFLVKWKIDILSAAAETSMTFCASAMDDDNDDQGQQEDFLDDDRDDDMECLLENRDEDDEEENEEAGIRDVVMEYVVTLDDDFHRKAWATQPIWKLPVVSIGLFHGERSGAKAMTKKLAMLWDIPEPLRAGADDEDDRGRPGARNRRDAGARKGGRTKTKGLQQYRKRGGGNRQAWQEL